MDQRSSLDFEEHARRPFPALSLSLMRLSVPARLAIAAPAVAAPLGRDLLGSAPDHGQHHPPSIFRDLTLGYDRHPAVHHVTGEVAQGELLAACRSERRRQVDAAQRPDGRDQAARRQRSTSSAVIAIAISPISRSRSTSTAASRSPCSTAPPWGCGARSAHLARPRCQRPSARSPMRSTALGILDLANRPIGALSGGQFQRVLFARLLLQDCRLILLDEPFRAVDAKTVADLILAHQALARRGPHRDRRAARHRAGARAFRRRLCCSPARSWPGAIRATVLTRRKPRQGAPRVCEAWEEHAGICERHARGQGARTGMIDALTQPFVEFAFMRRALVGLPCALRSARRRSACSSCSGA